MALFSRRDLQRALNENACLFDRDQVEEHVQRLNKIEDNYLSAEWEVVLLNAFSKVGHTQHHPNLNSNRLVDITFESLAPSLSFAADVVTVSDQPQHKRNPVDRLWSELRTQVRKRKIATGGFQIDVGHAPETRQGKGVRVALLIPPSDRFHKLIFNNAFDEFIEGVKCFPSRPAQYRIVNSKTNIVISYIPTRKGIWSGGLPNVGTTT